MKRFPIHSPAFFPLALSGFLIGAASAERIFYDSFETADSNGDPVGWQTAGHPSYLGVAAESSTWTTPYGERGMSTYSSGVGTRTIGFLPEASGDYTAKFNITSNAAKGEYRAELWVIDWVNGPILLGHAVGDTNGSKDMSFSGQITWRYNYEFASTMDGAELQIKLMQDPLRADWRNTPIWDNVSVDFIPDIDISPPTVVDIVDDRDGVAVAPDSTVTYTVTFSEAMDASTVDTSDFGNASSSSVVIESVSPTSDETVFLVAARPTDAGLLRLRINQSAALSDAAGNAMNTSSAIQDNVTITVDATNPILLPLNIADDKEGGTVTPNTDVNYTLTFSKDINAQSVTAADLGNAGSAPFTISSISETTPTSGIFTIVVVPSGSGTLRLKINGGALLLGADGGSLDTSSDIEDDTEITVDGTSPTLVPADITDDQDGGPVVVNTLVTYTLFFSEDMDDATVDTTDFGNAGNAPFTISSVGEASPGVFRVELMPTGGGTLRLRVNSGAVITDAAGNPLNSIAAILDDTTLTVEGPPSLAPSDIVDDRNGAPAAANAAVIYTVTFSKDMDAATVTADDFGNAGTAPVVIGSVSEISPGVFTVEVTATDAGSLRLQVIAGANLMDVSGTVLDTASAILDDTTIDIDTTPPTLTATSIVDDKNGNPVALNELVTYTLTFSEDISAATVSAEDFGNSGTSSVTIGAVAEITPGVFTVQATPTSAGTLILRINQSAVLSDLAGNNLDTSFAIADNTTITVDGAVVNPFGDWSGGASLASDQNLDGVANGIAWVIGAASPAANANLLLPTFDAKSDPNFAIFTFRRKDDAKNDPGTLITVGYGTALTGWTVATHDGTNIVITETDNYHSVTPGIDRVEVKLRKSVYAPDGKLFVRLGVASAP